MLLLLKRNMPQILCWMCDGTFFSSGHFKQLLTCCMNIKNDLGQYRKELVYSVYLLSKERSDYEMAFREIFKHLKRELDYVPSKVACQVDAEKAMYLGFEAVCYL